MFKRLAGPTGEIADVSVARPEDTPERIVRNAILVHSGPNGKAMTLASSDGDITFDEDRIQRVVENHNAMISKLALQYGGFDKMPVGAYPPILDQHSDDSNDRIRGRLTGLLKFERRSVPKVGDDVACAICDITFLGRETVEQVKDGRIYHLSVGIDESSDTLGETSTVIEPAAPGAMVLKKSDKKSVELNAKKTKDKKMGKKAASLAKLEAIKGELKNLSAKSKEGTKTIRLAKRKDEVKARFTKLMSDKKMSPAEFKKLDLTKLAKLDKESFDSVMDVYDSRESLVKSGQQGSVTAANFSDVGTKSAEDREVKRLKAAVKKNLSASGMKFKEMAADEDDEKDLAADEPKDEKKELAGVGEETAEVGGDAQHDVEDKDAMMKMIEENTAQIARVASMVNTIIDEMKGDDGEESDEESDDSENEKELEKSDDDKEGDK